MRVLSCCFVALFSSLSVATFYVLAAVFVGCALQKVKGVLLSECSLAALRSVTACHLPALLPPSPLFLFISYCLLFSLLLSSYFSPLFIHISLPLLASSSSSSCL